MKLRLLIYILGAITGLTACIERDNSEFTDIPIIKSYLRPGDCLRLNVSRQIPFSYNVSYSSDDIDDLKITVTNNNIDYILTPLGGGNYIDSSLIVAEGERYDLFCIYNSKNVTAYTEVPLKPFNFKQSATSISVMRMDSTTVPTGGGGMWVMPEPLKLTWVNNDDTYYILVIENMEETLDPVRDFGDDKMPEWRFRKAPTTSSGIQMRPQEFQYFGNHRIILYHVLPDYASLYDENTASSQNLTNPSTSIMNGYGIFTGLNADTLYLYVNEQ
ncbi:MAG TPA: hypothetical protein DDW27_18035 [Bacteroidales bacterium]|nr:hypothetical protein [Bacteroidales bacterium]